MSETPAPVVTRYAKSGDLHIAYQVMGQGPLDLVLVPGYVSHLEVQQQSPWAGRFFERLSSFSRLIRFDKRGTGLSDRVSAMPTLEERMDDVRAVMDAVGSSRAALLGWSEGGPMSILFAATYPQRTSALVLFGSYARITWAADYQWGRTEQDVAARYKLIEETWGQGNHVELFAPSMASNTEYRKWQAFFERSSASPGAAIALLRMNTEIDVRHVLPAVAVQALVLHRLGDRVVKVQHGRYLREHLKGAHYIELPGDDHLPFTGDTDALCDEIQVFLTGVRSGPDPDRVLATVLFTDIVGSTKLAAEMGDRGWKELLGHHHNAVRQQIERHRGREIDTAGDGFLAAFDGPARAVKCARATVDAAKNLGITVRAGVHTGECEMMGGKLSGIAVHIGARVGALAQPGEVLVSSTVKDLVAGSGLHFEPRGAHALKGVPGEWSLFAAV
ncbi:MAG TPA: adenylate/guanylate cyclase domain-containing protein [Steroidobacteraceae bacterium]|nr:adenylate/guanylate cyclase domain-containing protein [Steroidobacteraceae bacterium]